MESPQLREVPVQDSLAIVSGSAAHTAELGRQLASLLKVGAVVPLWGGFGAGKTTFVQGVGRGLGVERPMVSPSFGLVHSYSTAVPALTLYHLDLYRIAGLQEAEGFGVEEALEAGVALVEWPGPVLPILPADCLEVLFEYEGGDERRLTFRALGADAARTLAGYRTRLERS